MPAKKKKATKTVTTAQKLGSVIKSARDIMRKDKGLNGELDRLPQLTWIMFLKLLDDAEKLREDEAELAGKHYKSAIQAPYRWRDWAANENFTSDRLKNFINNDEADLPDGTKSLGLLAYLRSLKSKTGRDRPDVIAKVFKDVNNRMIRGTLLFDVLSKIDQIQFNKSEEVNILSLLYESMLKEMRDAAGDSGEFYTPRPVIRFMVEVIAPKLGETILDPACGTGGFLVEAYEYLKKQTTATDWQILQQSIIGGEAKSLPLMLAHMNLLLHGFEYPDKEDLLKNFNLHTIVRLPNGVFEPYTKIPTNLLFFDSSQPTEEIWYYEIPLPEGRKNYTKTKPIQDEAFADCVEWWNKREANEQAWKYNFKEVKEKAIAEATLHWNKAKQAEATADKCVKQVKELEGKIKYLESTILDFTPKKEQKEIKTQIKTIKQDIKQLQTEEKQQREIAKEEQIKGDAIYWAIYNLDRKNPNSGQDFEHLPPEQLLADILEKDRRVAEIMNEINSIINQ